MKLKKILIGILTSTISFTVSAKANWQYLSSSDTGIAIYVDANSIKNVPDYGYGQNRQFWSKHLIVEDLIEDRLGVGDYRLTMYWINCDSSTLGMKALTIFKLKNNRAFVDASYTIQNSEVEMEPILPDSIGNDYLEGVCH